MTATPPSRRGPSVLRKAAAWLPPCAGLLGTAGIMVSAAAAHLGGGSLVNTGGLFLLFHAATVMALAGLAERAADGRYVVAGLLLVIGSVIFAGDLTLAGLYGWRPVPPAAPIGGLLLIAGWLTVPVFASASILLGSRRQP